MKLTKILAMLLALCMIICCFAACNSGSGSDDDDDDEKIEEKDEKDEDEDEDDGKGEVKLPGSSEGKAETTKPVDADEPKPDAMAEGIVGKWEGTVNFGALIDAMYDMETGAKLDLTWTFEFEEDGDYTTGVKLPSKSKIEGFYEDLVDFTIAQGMEEEGITDKQELAESVGFDSYDELYDYFMDSYSEMFDEMLGEMEQEESGEYEYEDGVIVFDDDSEVEIELDGDEFVVKSSDSEDLDLVLTGVKFERQ